MVFCDSSDLDGERSSECLFYFGSFLVEELLKLFDIHFFEIYFGDCDRSRIFALRKDSVRRTAPDLEFWQAVPLSHPYRNSVRKRPQIWSSGKFLSFAIICLLVKLGFIPSEMAILLVTSRQNIANIRKYLLKRYFEKDGIPADFDREIQTL